MPPLRPINRLWRLGKVQAVALVIGLSACTASREGPAIAKRDSVGVQIIESFKSEWRPGEEWQIDSLPQLSIGVDQGADEYQFSRIHAATRLRDGTIVVTNSASRQVRFYDSTGRFRRASGGPGAGPGDFGSSLMKVFQVATGELWISDDARSRVNVLSPDGEFIKTIRLAPPVSTPRVGVRESMADGTLIASGLTSDGTTTRGRPNQVIGSEWAYLRYDATGRYLGPSLTLPGQPRFWHEFLGTPNTIAVPLTQGAFLTAKRDMLVVYRGTPNELEERSPTGQLLRIVRWQGPAPRSVSSIWERYKIASLESFTPLGRTEYKTLYESTIPLPSHVPTTEGLLSDDQGNTWARRYRLPWEVNKVWDVFSPEGIWLGPVTTPPNLSVMQIGDDFILGVHHDDFGVERVQLHALIKVYSAPSRATR